MDVLSRFLKYITIDTTSDSKKEDTPSTEGQIKLAKLLVSELHELNLDEIHFDQEHCYVYAKLNGNQSLPKIGFVSHLDTSEDAVGKGIKPRIISNYNGNDITLNENVLLSTNTYPDLKKHIGKTLITSDGNTLLGADDKAGIAEIMCMLECLTKSIEDHGDVFVCFTPDEEIGQGTIYLDKKYFYPDFAYTVDGADLGEFSYENFNAANAIITISGNATHTGSAKNLMVNAIRIATVLNSLLPGEIPENTENYDGFFHLDKLEGNVSKARMEYLIRDFDKINFEKRKQLLSKIVASLNVKYNNCVQLYIKDSYRNMYEVIKNRPDIVKNTLEALKQANINPIISPIRGGTDGAEISFNGIPCPNLGTGGHNFHSIYEYVCKEDMEKTSELLVSIVRQFAKNKKSNNIRIRNK